MIALISKSAQMKGVSGLTDEELKFYILCGPLEDAIDLLEQGQCEKARALLQRILEQAHRLYGDAGAQPGKA